MSNAEPAQTASEAAQPFHSEPGGGSDSLLEARRNTGSSEPESEGEVPSIATEPLTVDAQAAPGATEGPLPADPARSDNAPAARRGVGWLVPVLGTLAWQLLATTGVLPENWFPAPSRILATLAQLAANGTLLRHIGATLTRVLIGFTLGASAATVLGIATARSRQLRDLLDPSLQALRSIPSLAWVPLFMLWLGIGEASKIALIALGAFFPVYLNLITSLLAIDPRLLEVARLFGYRGARLARTVLLPATLPAYVAGLRSGLGLGWMFVVAAELMGASRGLGYLLVDGQTTSRPELVMAAILLFATLGKLSDLILEKLGQHWQRWRAD